MTKIALPHWQGRVSPVFDVARQVILAEVSAGAFLRRGNLVLGAEDPQCRSVLLASAGVEVLICGAISWPFEIALSAAGITVVSQICGQVDNVLRAYATGRLDQSHYFMPGCRRLRNGGQRRGGEG